MTTASNPSQGFSTAEIYQALRSSILDGELAAPNPLRQDELATRFGVSKIPVREALRQLESDGLVEFKPRRGAFVVELTEADVLEVLEIRIALESRALELAIPNMTDTDLDLAREILQQYERVSDYEIWCKLNSRFHQCIYQPCGLTKLLTMIKNEDDRAGSFMRMKITIASGFDRPHTEHKAILRACEKGDVKSGVSILRQHIENTKKEITAYFRRLAVAKTLLPPKIRMSS